MKSSSITLLVMTALVAVFALGRFTGAQPAAAENEGQAEQDKRALSYGLGFYLGEDVRQGLEADGVGADRALIVKGFTDGLSGQQSQMDRQTLDAVLVAVHKEMQSRAVKRMLKENPEFKKLHDENLSRSHELLKANAEKDGVIVMPNGVQCEILAKGEGASPGPNDTVILTYRAMRTDGQVYDARDEREMEVAGMMRPAAAVLQTMKVGEKRRVVFPPDQAYGAAGLPPAVGPNEVITVEAVLVRIVDDNANANANAGGKGR